MARKTHVVLIDDLDGSEAMETVTFGLDGAAYEIDLNDDNANRFREVLSEWVSRSRRTGGRARRGTRGTAAAGDTAKVREWAKNNGYSVSERGRVAQEIRDAYYAAY